MALLAAVDGDGCSLKTNWTLKIILLLKDGTGKEVQQLLFGIFFCSLYITFNFVNYFLGIRYIIQSSYFFFYFIYVIFKFILYLPLN